MSASPLLDPGLRQFGDALMREVGRMIGNRIGGREVSVKDTLDLVTDLDHAIEGFVRQRVNEAYPHHALLGEESAHAGPPRVDGYCWVLDPLDGTVNFSFDLPFYGTSLALLCEGDPLVGWVVDPLRDETFFAQRGEPATLNGRRLSVASRVEPMSTDGKGRSPLPIAVSTGLLAHLGRAPNGTAALTELTNQFGKLRILGSQALQVCYVAAGRLGAAINLEARLWDDAAAALILQQAGGRYSDVLGRPIFPVHAAGGLLSGDAVRSIAAEPAAHAAILTILRDTFDPAP